MPGKGEKALRNLFWEPERHDVPRAESRCHYLELVSMQISGPHQRRRGVSRIHEPPLLASCKSRGEDLIWSWIRDICDEITRTLPPEEAASFPDGYQWTRRLLGGLVDAQIASSPQHDPTKALKTFAGLVKLVRKGSKYYKYLPITNAATAISTRLAASDCPPVDDKLFDNFCSAFAMHDSLSLASRSAKYQLYHPSRPTATEYYRMVAAGSPRLSEDFFDGIREQGKRRLAVDFLRAAYILRHRGREPEARHLEDIVQRKSFAMYQRRDRIIRQFARDVRLESVRRESALEGSGD